MKKKAVDDVCAARKQKYIRRKISSGTTPFLRRGTPEFYHGHRGTQSGVSDSYRDARHGKSTESQARASAP